jgi:hypothetical protein
MALRSYLVFENSTPLSYSSFTNYIFGRKPPRIVRGGFPERSCFIVRKADKSINFTAGGMTEDEDKAFIG